MPPTIIENADLRRLNTFAVPARAARLVELDETAGASEALAACAGHGPMMVLGAGSNVLFTRDFEGSILRVRTCGRRIVSASGDEVVVEAQAGESWDGFVRWTLAGALFGLENLSLIPGCVGASPIQNIGAYGVEMCEFFDSLEAIDLDTGAQRRFDAPQCGFAYRDSVFKHGQAARWLILGVRFRLSRTARPRFDYAELRGELARSGVAHPSPDQIARCVVAIRSSKLPDPALLGNAGSFFKNPIVDLPRAKELIDRHPGMPNWPASQGIKLSAAWMIDRCGLKGAREGDAGVHDRHALVLVNHGSARGCDIWALAMRVRDAVHQRFGIVLEPEPTIV
ncbi:MAG: UDP-N-acetylmuramate dehydrogenase [Burkholderiaceae bacterium]|nr:UDP-N-acetylmuramate dehydrogenase [Burkholderiaceae bacterium]